MTSCLKGYRIRLLKATAAPLMNAFTLSFSLFDGQESLGHDPLAREIQFPEFRSALREKRSLLDGDRYPVSQLPIV